LCYIHASVETYDEQSTLSYEVCSFEISHYDPPSIGDSLWAYDNILKKDVWADMLELACQTQYDMFFSVKIKEVITFVVVLI